MHTTRLRRLLGTACAVIVTVVAVDVGAQSYARGQNVSPAFEG